MAASRGIPVLYEDNHLLAVVKPPGIPSQADESGDADMLTLLKQDLKIRHDKPGNVFLGLVHRLDRPVGGVMLFAKTSKAAGRLSDSVRTRTFSKTYVAVLNGKPPRSKGQLKHYLDKDPKRNVVAAYDKPRGEAKEARLSYAVLGEAEGLTLAAVRLHTGRPHQIRVQMAAIGCPLHSDLKYGAPVPRVDKSKSGHADIALWSAAAGIPHPVSKEWMIFASRPPSSYPWNLWEDSRLDGAALHLETEFGAEAGKTEPR